MKQINGHWLPDDDREKWLVKAGLDERGWSMYQRDRLEAIVKYCPEHRRRRFVDGGAHVGLYSRPAGMAFRTVEAFEPHPDTYSCLFRNIGYQHTNVSTWPYALAERTGEIEMAHSKRGSSMSTATVDSHTVVPEAFTVETVTIDSFDWTDVDAIKLDLEGGEFNALCGAVQTIKQCRPVVLIEDKHDPEYLASNLLITLGMKQVWSAKHDRLFVWP